MSRRSLDTRGIIDQRKLDANTLVDTTSLIAKYDVLVRENAPEAMSTERCVMLFQVLDNVLPHTGIFKALLFQIRNELFDYVFSSEHHTGQRTAVPLHDATADISLVPADGSAGAGFVQRVPHFALLARLLDSQDVTAEGLRGQVNQLQARLFNKNRQFEDTMETVAARNAEIEELLKKINDSEAIVATKDKEIKKLHQDIDLAHHSFEKTKRRSGLEINAIQAELQEKNEEVQYLKKYKSGYDTLNDAFHEDLLDAMIPEIVSPVKIPVLATKKETLISSIQSAKKLEKQLLSVMNTVIEEYDTFVEEQKEELSQIVLINQDDIVVQKKYEREIDRADQELSSVQERFKKTIVDINVELSLLRQHYTMFEEELQKIEETEQAKLTSSLAVTVEDPRRPQRIQKPATQPGNEPKPTDKISREEIRNFSLAANNQDGGESRDDPFVPHERVLSKYAVMLFYSQDGGKVFHLHQDCKYCESCEEKTVACPHKVIEANDTILLMPHRVTHLKLKRPPVRIARQPTTQEADAMSYDATAGFDSTADDGASVSTLHDEEAAAGPATDLWRRAESTLAAISGSGGAAGAAEGESTGLEIHPITSIWDDYEARTDAVTSIHRSLSSERALSLLEQLYAYVVGQDDASAEDGSEYQSVLDKVYSYFMDRYLEEKAAFIAVHDFLSAVIEHASHSRLLQLFANALAGNVDFSVCRYVLLLGNHIDSVKWMHTEDVRAFLGLIYPFLQDDDLESLQMGYVSFAENKLSKSLVHEYVLYIILKGREPRFLEMEHQLMQFPSRQQGIMTDAEFAEASDNILQLSNETLRKRLFLEAECLLESKSNESTRLPVMKLAHMLAYMQLLEYSQKVKDNIGVVVEKSRIREAEQGPMTIPLTAGGKGSQIITMHRVRNLSYNLSRRERFRKERAATE